MRSISASFSSDESSAALFRISRSSCSSDRPCSSALIFKDDTTCSSRLRTITWAMRADMLAAWRLSTVRVVRVDPDLLGRLGGLDLEIDHHRLLVAAHQHAFERLVGARVDLLVRHEGRHEDEVAGIGLGDILQ